MVTRNNTYFYDEGCFSDPDMFVGYLDQQKLFRFDGAKLSLNTTYTFLLRVAKDKRESFFSQVCLV